MTKWHDFDKKKPPVSGDEYLIVQDIGKRFATDSLPYGAVGVAVYYEQGERIPFTNPSHYTDETPEEKLHRIIKNPDYWISVGAFYREDDEGDPIPVYGVRYWRKMPRVPLEFLGNQNAWRSREE